MRLRNIPGADEVIKNSKYVIQNPMEQKGKFITNMAQLNPDVNYIGIELYTSVLLRAVQKLDDSENMQSNLRFLCVDAKEINNIFDEGEIDRIYLNFSDPWPKDRHAKRRLPSRQFLERYIKCLKPEGRIEFKTDNRDLFDFAVEEAKDTGWKFDALTYDLHHDEALVKNNVMTEYEEKFSSIGNPIHKYIIHFPRE